MNSIASAMNWLVGLLSGTIASVVAVTAVAAFALLALTGRIQIRGALRIVFGCFIIFGASSIAAGIQAAISISESDSPPAEIASPSYPVASPKVSSVPATTDPYAGAAMPQR